MKYVEYKYLVLSDLYRITANTKFSVLVRHIVLGEAYKYIFWMRTCRYSRDHPVLKYTIFPFARLLLEHYKYKLGISLPFVTDIGSGFYIGHFGGIVVNAGSRIGKNCNLSHGVTLGQANRGRNKGYPIIGNNVYIGPGAKIIGAVKIGNNVAVGANCVVTRDVPDNAVVVGVPGQVISYNGAEDYVINIDYEDMITGRSPIYSAMDTDTLKRE
jgi:serine O-acetyltransferase